MTLLGLSESLTAGRPSASTTLQTNEIALSCPSTPAGAQPTKSLVRLVPQPIDTLTCPRSARSLFDRIDVHRVGQHDKLLPRITASFLPPVDELPRRRDR